MKSIVQFIYIATINLLTVPDFVSYLGFVEGTLSSSLACFSIAMFAAFLHWGILEWAFKNTLQTINITVNNSEELKKELEKIRDEV